MLRERASLHLQLPIRFLDTLAHTASYRYKEFTIAKRSGGTRTIHHPSRSLKAVQRWLGAQVLSSLPVHGAAMAYRPGKSIRDNANLHRGARFVLRIDFQDFFPSLGIDDIEALLQRNPEVVSDWSQLDHAWFIKLVTRYGQLTIGAPTSPALSNALCYELDAALQELSRKTELRYSRYADDLVFSTGYRDRLRNVPDWVEEAVRSLPYPRNLRINAKKTHHSSMKHRQSVTGLILTTEGATSVGRALKRKIKAFLHSFEKLSTEERKWLAGTLGYLRSVEPAYLNNLAMKYGAQRVLDASRKEQRASLTST